MDIIVDTDALLWMSQGSSRLGKETRGTIEEAIRGGRVRFSPISMLEATIAPFALGLQVVVFS
ncbi:MAG: hypothetical protein OXT07_02585 [bacterium]|nr:hypothetical protein [bacterium]MDE0216794.1 hypothetical protein [bacterium]